MKMKAMRVVLLLLVFVVHAHCGVVGILYEGWHAFAVDALNQVAAKGGQQLTVEDVIFSNGNYTLHDVYDKYDVPSNVSLNFYYQTTPAAGFYCIYAKRPNETGWGVSDCENIEQTTARHAKQLVTAGIDFVAVDATNIPTMSAQGDVLQLRPLEILFAEWASLRQAGIATPKITAWGCLPTGATLWQNYLDLYNNPAYADLVLVDEFTNKKVFFTTNNPNETIVQLVESNGGRNDVVVQLIWAQLSPSEMLSGAWTFFSPCFVNNVTMSTSVVGMECNQIVTTNAAIGPHGTQMAVSPSYQLSYSSLPFAAPGKLAGLTFKSQFYNAFAAQPDYLFVSSFNEFIAQPQANPFLNVVNTAFDMGLPTDPYATSLYVDSYGFEFSRDIEPTTLHGSYIYDLMSSCLSIFKSGATTCNQPSSLCCQSSDFFVNVHSLSSTPSLSIVDFLLSTSTNEVETLVSGGTYAEVCTPFGGSTIFPSCSEGSYPNAQSGPFIIYNQQLYPDLIALYRCRTGDYHFFSTQPDCEGCTTESTLGLISPTCSRETFRALYRCLNRSNSAHYHSLDLACPPSDTDAGLLGYVR